MIRVKYKMSYPIYFELNFRGIFVPPRTGNVALSRKEALYGDKSFYAM